MNDIVRNELSGKKTIKDLFINVLQVLDIVTHMKVMSTLISFVGNLCSGKLDSKFRNLLRPDLPKLVEQLNAILAFISAEAYSDDSPKPFIDVAPHEETQAEKKARRRQARQMRRLEEENKEKRDIIKTNNVLLK